RAYRQAGGGLLAGVDHDHPTIVIGILDVQRFAGFPGTEISARWIHVIVVEMPVRRRPRVVQHPLNDPGGYVLVAAVSFEHGALSVIGNGLRLAKIVLKTRRRSIRCVHRFVETAWVLEALTRAVKIPEL